jgi:3-oxoacyl-[acyl-carrier-protein] synthase III
VPEQAIETAAPAVAAPRRTGAAVLSVGAALPEQVVTTAEIAEWAGTTEDWMVSRTGIRERRHAGPDERLADFATAAGAQALERAGVDPADVGLVLVGTLHADQITPNVAPEVAHRLGTGGAGAADVGAACNAFLSALGFGTAWIESGRGSTVLVIGADLVSRHTDFSDRRTAALFSDGAGALVLGGSADARIGPVLLRSDGAQAHTIHGSWEEGLFRMDGPEVFRHAVNRMGEVVADAIAAAGIGLGEVDLFVLHQANQRITHAITERMGLDPDKVVDTIGTLGNNSAATLPLALEAAREDGRLAAGATVALGAFGAGFTYGGAVLTWGGA